MKREKLSKSLTILLIFQMVLIILSTFVTGFVFGYLVSGGHAGIMLASSIFMAIAHVAIIVYAFVGYNGKPIYLYMALAFFALAVLVNTMMNFRTIWQLGLLTLLFGLLLAYICTLGNQRLGRILILSAVVIALAFSIYSSFIAKPQSLGEQNANIIALVAMYFSLFTPTLLSGTFALIHSIRSSRG